MNVKRLLLIILMIMTMIVVAACGSNDQTSGTSTDQTTDQDTEQSEEQTTDHASNQATEQAANQADGQTAEENDARDDTSVQSDLVTVETDFPDEAYILMNGTVVRVGDNFGNVEGKIGDEVKPAETFEPCDPNFEKPVVKHYYDGVSITTSDEGVIETVMLDIRDGESDSSFSGSVKLGDSIDKVKEILGEPGDDDEDDMFLTYYYGPEDDISSLLFYKDEEGNNTMTGVIMSKASITMMQQD